MKKRVLAFLCALLLLTGAVPFAAAQEGETLRAADALHTLGLINGTGTSGYALESPATRAQAAVLLVRLAGAQQDAAADNWFSGYRDVPTWASRAVHYAVHQGWIDSPASAGLDFHPDTAITADEWFTFLLRMLGYDDAAGDFSPDSAALFAQHIGLTPQVSTGSLSRGQLFVLLESALSFSYKDGSATVISRLIDRGIVSRAAANALGFLSPVLTARQVAERYTAAAFHLDVYTRQIELDIDMPMVNASGFFISADGLAVTNYHTIEDSVHAVATLSTGEVYPVQRVLYYDPDADIAVIQISKTSRSGHVTSAFAHLDIAPSGTRDVRPGDPVYTLSDPLGMGLAVSSGIISATNRDVERYSVPCLMSTADISQGSSGGALLNALGQVIGVTSGAYTYGNSMYLAVPIDPVLSADLTGEGWTIREIKEREAA
ncbi:S1C family serine protease [Dysosmobacter sp.]|uniref:S1C family serine protease n=1 Tax=Dysosmobacter sp. TaxID=2591382 RepID=UPI003FD74E6D